MLSNLIIYHLLNCAANGRQSKAPGIAMPIKGVEVSSFFQLNRIHSCISILRARNDCKSPNKYVNFLLILLMGGKWCRY